MADSLTKLLKILSNKSLWAFLIVSLFLTLYYCNTQTVNYHQVPSQNTCIIEKSEMQNYDDVRQSSSSVSILQIINFNRLFQLNLLFKFQLIGNFLIASVLLYLIFQNINRINSIKFFYQIYIKSSIPCRAGPIAKRGDAFFILTQIYGIKEEKN